MDEPSAPVAIRLSPSASNTRPSKRIHTDVSLKRWAALTHYIDDGELSIDNNRVENLIRPIALGRKNWLFAGPLRAGQRTATIMSLLHTARLNGRDRYQYLKDVPEGLPTQPDSRLRELLPYCWSPDSTA